MLKSSLSVAVAKGYVSIISALISGPVAVDVNVLGPVST
jgi:hypothetical protein